MINGIQEAIECWSSRICSSAATSRRSHKKIHIKILGWTLLISVLMPLARAATFDCDKASNFVEKAICSDSRLSRMDDQLGRLYKATLAASSNSSAVRSEQREWLSLRNQCKDFDCIVKAYADRISALSAASPPVTTSGGPGQYVVDGYVLGDQVDLNSPNYRSYDCKPSEEFEDAIVCERQQQKNNPKGAVYVSGTLIHARDGTALYAMVNAAPVIMGTRPVTMNTSVVQNEIQALSRAMNATPVSVIWFPHDTGTFVPPNKSVPTAVIASATLSLLEWLIKRRDTGPGPPHLEI